MEPFPVFTWIHLLRLYHLVLRCVQKELAGKGLTLSQFDLIAKLGSLPECASQEVLCEKLLLTKGNISGLIDRMVQEGWVLRWPDPKNRRCNRIQLAPQGKRIYQGVIPVYQDCLKKLFSPLPQRQLVRLNSLLHQLLTGIVGRTLCRKVKINSRGRTLKNGARRLKPAHSGIGGL